MVPQYVEVKRLSRHGNSHHFPAGSSFTYTLRQIPTTILELTQASQEPVPPERRARGDRGDGVLIKWQEGKTKKYKNRNLSPIFYFFSCLLEECSSEF